MDWEHLAFQLERYPYSPQGSAIRNSDWGEGGGGGCKGENL